MKRIVIIIIAILVIAAGGWTAFWFVNRGTAEEKMREALATLERAGVPNSYDAIAISGFPFSYRGEVANLALGDGGAGGLVTLPSVAAEVSVAAPDTVVFTLPPSFKVAPPDVPADQAVEVASRALTASVRLVDDAGAYDLKMDAEALSLILPDGGAPFEIEGLSAAGALDLRSAEPELSIKFAAAQATQTLSSTELDALSAEASMAQTATKTVANGFSVEIEGSVRRVASKAMVEKALVEFDHGGIVELRGLSYEAAATPKEQFDPSFLHGASDFGAALSAFGRMAGDGVARGGDARVGLQIAGVDGSGTLENGPAKIEIADLSLAVDLGAKRLGLTFASKKFLLDAKLPEDQVVYYDASDMNAEYFATPADAFDFSQIAELLSVGAPDGELVGQLITAAVGEQIMQGGALEMRGSAGPSLTRAPTAPGVAPFRQIESRVGPSAFRFALNPDEAVMKMNVDGLTYRVSGGFEGGGALEKLDLDVAAPLRAASQEQTAKLRFLVGEITLEDSVWALIDPNGALERSVPGTNISMDANVLIRRDVLSPEADLANLGDPAVLPGEITINDSFAEALGLRGDLSGAVSVMPLPQGALNLTVTGWKSFYSAIQKTPVVSDQEAMASLQSLDALWTRYRDPGGAEDQAEFAIEIGSAGLMVNGAPFEPGPPPGSEPGAEPDQAPEEDDPLGAPAQEPADPPAAQ